MTPTSTATDIDAEALDLLRALTGRDDAVFHDGQLEAIRALVADRRRALVVQRTGWGKSAVYFIATLLLRRRGTGPTLLVSPLLALMRDQVAAAGIVGTMVTAVRKVHLAKGPWVTEGGYEYNAVLIAAAAALASGPGGPSVDQLFGKKSWGAGGTVFALVAGVVASFVAVELGKRATPPAEPGSDSSAG